MSLCCSVRGVVLVTSLGFLGASAFGASVEATKAKVVKQLAASRKTVVGDFKKALKNHRKALDTALDAIDAQLKAGTGSSTLVGDVFTALQAVQTATRDQIDLAEGQFAQARSGAMTLLASVGLSEPKDYPSDLVIESGGASDQIGRDIEAALSVSLDATTKRMRATADLFEDKLDLLISFKLGRPGIFHNRSVTETGGSSIYSIPLTIDVILAVSTPDVSNDAAIYLSGSGLFIDGPLELRIAHGSVSGIIPQIPAADYYGRWSHTLTNVDENDYNFGLHQTGKFAGFARESLTVR